MFTIQLHYRASYLEQLLAVSGSLLLPLRRHNRPLHTEQAGLISADRCFAGTLHHFAFINMRHVAFLRLLTLLHRLVSFPGMGRCLLKLIHGLVSFHGAGRCLPTLLQGLVSCIGSNRPIVSFFGRRAGVAEEGASTGRAAGLRHRIRGRGGGPNGTSSAGAQGGEADLLNYIVHIAIVS